MIQPVLLLCLVYPLCVHLLKRPTFPLLAALEHRLWSSREGVEQLQEKKLAELIGPTYQHCSWYREWLMAIGIESARRVSYSDPGYFHAFERNAW